jgi:hypothetical protein
VVPGLVIVAVVVDRDWEAGAGEHIARHGQIGVRGVQDRAVLGAVVGEDVVVQRDRPNITDTAIESHYSVLKTIETWAGVPLLGHAADATTNVIDPRLIPTTTTPN